MPIPDSVFTLNLAKAHLRVLHTEEDAIIGAYYDAAVERCEEWTGKAWTERAIKFMPPQAFLYPGARIPLPLAPVKTITSFTYYQTGTPAPIAVPADTYRVETVYSGQQVLVLDSVPSDMDPDVTDPMIFDYVAAPASGVPPAVVAAALLYLGDLYNSREANIIGTIATENRAAVNLLAPHRVTLGM